MIAFKPAPFLKNGHLQTLYPALFTKTIDLEVQEEKFTLPDGDFLECVWYKKPKVGDKTPIVILFHGLAGSVNSPYIQRAMKALGDKGFAISLMHFRGCGKEMNSLARSYHSGETEDAKAWIEHIQKHYHDSALYAVGYSLGGNMLLKLLGELGVDSPLKAAVAVSVPMVLESSADTMNEGFSKLYQYNLMEALKRQLIKKYAYHDMHKLIGIREVDVKKLTSFWEFDDVYTAPIHGFKDAKEYYAKSSSRQYLKTIETNTLIIHALDDPFMSKKVIPKEDELSKQVTLECYENGGHVGFVSGTIFKPHYWLESRIIRYFKTYDTIRST